MAFVTVAYRDVCLLVCGAEEATVSLDTVDQYQTGPVYRAGDLTPQLDPHGGCCSLGQMTLPWNP